MALALLVVLGQAAALDPDGVYIDPEGVLRARKVEDGRRLRELRAAARKEKAAAGLVFVSLPRLLAEARACVEAGRPLPEEVRTLRGMVRLQYLFVFPAEKDLVIAGRAEPVVSDFPGRPVGRLSGRPVLQLDDLVVALRTCGPGRVQNAFGCTIELTAEVQRNLAAKWDELKGAVKDQPARRRELFGQLAKAGGLQPVEFFNLAPETRFAYVCLEADYLLKRHALGLDPSPVKEAPSHLSLMSSTKKFAHRFWFEARYEPVRVSADGTAYEIAGPSLQIRTRRKFSDDADDADPEAKKYAAAATEHLPKLAETLLPWADLSNLADLGLAAALIGADGLHEKAGWDPSWTLKDYPVAKVAVPTSAEVLVNYTTSSNLLLWGGGGVKLSMAEAARARRPDADGTLAAKAARPAQGWAR
jgi:hypothetical protein